jgi:hypothetical protein
MLYDLPQMSRIIKGMDPSDLLKKAAKILKCTIDGLVKSHITGHCEERSDEAILLFQVVIANEIASLRSQ